MNEAVARSRERRSHGRHNSRPMTPLRAKFIRDLVIRGRQKTLRKPIPGASVIWHAITPFARADLLRGSHGLAAPSHQGAPTGSLEHPHRRERRVRFLYAVTLGRERIDLVTSVPQTKRAIGPAENHLRFTLNRPATEGARTLSASLSDHSCKVATLPVFAPEDPLTPETLYGAHWALLLLRRVTEHP